MEDKSYFEKLESMGDDAATDVITEAMDYEMLSTIQTYLYAEERGEKRCERMASEIGLLVIEKVKAEMELLGVFDE